MIETNDDSIINSLERVSNLLAMYTNAKSIKTIKGNTSIKEIRPIFNKLGPEFKQHAQIVAEELKKAGCKRGPKGDRQTWILPIAHERGNIRHKA